MTSDDNKALTPAQIAARKAFKAEDAKKALSEHEVKEKAFHDNRERLKAERLAREAKAKEK